MPEPKINPIPAAAPDHRGCDRRLRLHIVYERALRRYRIVRACRCRGKIVRISAAFPSFGEAEAALRLMGGAAAG